MPPASPRVSRASTGGTTTTTPSLTKETCMCIATRPCSLSPAAEALPPSTIATGSTARRIPAPARAAFRASMAASSRALSSAPLPAAPISLRPLGGASRCVHLPSPAARVRASSAAWRRAASCTTSRVRLRMASSAARVRAAAARCRASSWAAAASASLAASASAEAAASRAQSSSATRSASSASSASRSTPARSASASSSEISASSHLRITCCSRSSHSLCGRCCGCALAGLSGEAGDAGTASGCWGAEAGDTGNLRPSRVVPLSSRGPLSQRLGLLHACIGDGRYNLSSENRTFFFRPPQKAGPAARGDFRRFATHSMELRQCRQALCVCIFGQASRRLW
eukprot:scaffold11776_cov107-Isochrysis_galbana.AAC.4